MRSGSNFGGNAAARHLDLAHGNHGSLLDGLLAVYRTSAICGPNLSLHDSDLCPTLWRYLTTERKDEPVDSSRFRCIVPCCIR